MDRIRSADQESVIRYWDELDEESQIRFEKQLLKVDWNWVQSLNVSGVKSVDWDSLSARAEPAPAIELEREHSGISRAEATREGERLLRAGKVAQILVAGGQGTRLGFDKPKGLYPIGPLSQKTLLQLLIEKVIGASDFYETAIPVLIMTSPATHDETIEYLTANKRFGLAEDQCVVFCQGTMPAVDSETGKLLLESKGRLFASPNGHGGMVQAFSDHGCLELLKSKGIESIFYGQIDNPLLQVCDALTLGYHHQLKSEMTSQVVRKIAATQKVGNVVSLDGKIQIIEYSDLPEAYAKQTDAEGKLKLWAGSIAVHVFETKFLERMIGQPESLPYHQASKKVPFVDDLGNAVEPGEPNAIKFEKFIFDLLPFAQNALAVEVLPRDGFAAVKNAAPAETETPETTQSAMMDLYRRWLDGIGVHVEPDVQVEISPLFAFNEKHLGRKIIETNTVIEPTYFQ